MKKSLLHRVGKLTAEAAGSKKYSVGYNEDIKRIVVTLDRSARINTRLIQEVTGYKVQQNGRFVFYSKQ